MSENRIEKKFLYLEGDESYKYFLISGMFKEIYSERMVNSIYFDTDDLKNLWENINGFGNRTKIRLRWYNELKNSEVFLEEKKKKNITTIKKVVSLGFFSNLQDLDSYIKSEKFLLKTFVVDKKINLKKKVWVSYNRRYFRDTFKKLRVTLDQNINVFIKYTINIPHITLIIIIMCKYLSLCGLIITLF